MKIISVQNRIKRRTAIYCWKTIEKLDPNCEIEIISETEEQDWVGDSAIENQN